MFAGFVVGARMWFYVVLVIQPSRRQGIVRLSTGMACPLCESRPGPYGGRCGGRVSLRQPASVRPHMDSLDVYDVPAGFGS